MQRGGVGLSVDGANGDSDTSFIEGHAHTTGRSRLSALFDEAWRRARRRRWALGLAALGLALAAGALLAGHQRAPVASLPVRPPAPVPAPVRATLHLPRAPYVGVACPAAPNSIACDRVGIAVWLRHAPTRLVAEIGSRAVVLRDQQIGCPAHGRACNQFFAGYLTHAGLLDGALRVTPDRGRYRWYGRHPVHAVVRLRATYRDGRVERATRRVELAPGWG